MGIIIYTEIMLADAFAQKHYERQNSDRIRYAARLTRWLVWNDYGAGGWMFDNNQKVIWLVRQFLRDIADRTPAQARYIASTRRMRAVLDLARGDPLLAASEDDIAEAEERQTRLRAAQAIEMEWDRQERKRINTLP